MTTLFDTAAHLDRLADWGVLSAQGEDATRFLQGQLTNDVALMPEGAARLSGYCSAKGRLMASFVVLKNAPDHYLLLMSADLLLGIQKRLQMFVMRAKCTLKDETSGWSLIGVTGGTTLPEMADWSCRADGAARLIRLPSGEAKQGLLIQPKAVDGADPHAELPVIAPGGVVGPWPFHRAMSGVPMVTQATAELFVPQMINYESVQGVSFKKGCYPGQEVVARSQFRGAIKRRAAVFTLADPERAHAVAPGQSVFAGGEPDAVCGTVASVGYLDGQWALTVSLQTAAASGPILLGSDVGPRLMPLPLPYPILDDI